MTGERRPGEPDPAVFRIPEKQPTEGEGNQVEIAKEVEEEGPLPAGVLGWLRKLERSNFGFALKLTAALSLTRMATESSIPRDTQHQVEQADRQRWEDIHERHPELAKPEAEFLSEAVPDQQAEILRQRDVQYKAAINDAVTSYFETVGRDEDSSADMQTVQSTLQQHRPSEVDRTLLKMAFRSASIGRTQSSDSCRTKPVQRRKLLNANLPNTLPAVCSIQLTAAIRQIRFLWN